MIFMNSSAGFIPAALAEQMNENGRQVRVMRLAVGGEAVVRTKHDGAIGACRIRR
jgi:protein-L-isoaspartate O-methyltransferase